MVCQFCLFFQKTSFKKKNKKKQLLALLIFAMVSLVSFAFISTLICDGFSQLYMFYHMSMSQLKSPADRYLCCPFYFTKLLSSYEVELFCMSPGMYVQVFL